MDCSTAEEMVTRYINRDLSVEELEKFLNHIENCESCYDELETYFIAHEVTRQLSEEEDTELDFKKRLDHDLKKSRRLIVRKKMTRFCRITVLLIALASLMVAGMLLIFR